MELLYEDLAKKNGSQLFHIEKDITTESIPNMQMELKEIFQQLAEDSSWVFEDLTQKDTSYATHGFHKYPAKFIPQLARRCIEEYTKEEDVVCDPFMGCGTTLVEALVSGRKAIGTDINAVAWLITNTKSIPINPDKLNKEVERILNDIEIYLLSSKKQVQKNFCLCAFSNILKGSSIWLMKSIKPTRDLNKKPSTPYKAFSRQIKMMLMGNKELYDLMPEQVRNNLKEHFFAKKQDARSLPCKPNSVSLIITSPPYVTSYEYADLHQLTALWLEYAKDVAQFREGFIGSIHKKEFNHIGIKSELAKQEIEQLNKKSKR